MKRRHLVDALVPLGRLRDLPHVEIRANRRTTPRPASDATPRGWPAFRVTFKKDAIRPNGESPSMGKRCKKHGTQVRSLRRRVTLEDGRSIKVKAPICRRCEQGRGSNPKWAA